MEKAEYRDDVDFFRTVKQKCSELGIRWYKYKKECKEMKDSMEYKKINNYLSEIFPFVQQCKIFFEFIWYSLVLVVPVVLFLICFLV